MSKRLSITRIALAMVVPCAALLTIAPQSAHSAGPNVLRVGTFNSIPGTFTTIQSAVDAAQPGDWILVGPGDYRERQDYSNNAQPAGVWIQKSDIHLRGMNRNSVIVDGTKTTATAPCSSTAGDQDPGPSNQGRSGIVVYGIQKDSSGAVVQRFLADNVSIDNLTVCNFLTGSAGGTGNEIWWNGGDGTGRPNAPSIGLRGYEGSYLTATSSYSSSTSGSLGPCCGTGFPAGNYGIFSSNATGPVGGPAHGTFSTWSNSYASNMADSDFYVGACWQVCDMVMSHDHGQYSSLCVSATNAGGYYVMDHMECDLNKDGPVANSQNNDDAPSPQLGKCDLGDANEPQTGLLGTTSCTVWLNSNWHDNNTANVPGNSTNGLAGAGPVGTGVILAGTTYITLYHNTITNNKGWGELIVDLPDAESGPAMCQGGTDLFVPPPPAPPQTEVCYYRAFGNVSLGNTFLTNGGYGNPTNGDIGLASLPNNPGNCFSGDTNSGGVGGMPSTDPAGIETNPAYAPVGNMCTTPNAGDEGPLVAEAECSAQLLAPCPTIQAATCQIWPGPGPCPVPSVPGANYPRADASFTLTMPDATLTPTMPDPCAGVPSNPWCPALATLTPEVPYAALPVAVGGLAIGAFLLARRQRGRKASGDTLNS